MKAYITLITLGVDDLEKAVAFYRDGLGFPAKGAHLWEVAWNPADMAGLP
jgi:catechol 2,3-dioxygenase-like lactoylglutathione lyase family enzyme